MATGRNRPIDRLRVRDQDAGVDAEEAKSDVYRAMSPSDIAAPRRKSGRVSRPQACTNGADKSGTAAITVTQDPGAEGGV